MNEMMITISKTCHFLESHLRRTSYPQDKLSVSIRAPKLIRLCSLFALEIRQRSTSLSAMTRVNPLNIADQTGNQLNGKDRSLETEMVAIVSNRNPNSNPGYIRGILS
jgi:hypothetical protein